MRTTWNFHSAGQLVFGRGATGQLGALLARRKLSRAFLVADQRLAAAGLVERVVEPLARANITVEIYPGGEPEPAVSAAVTAANAASAFGPDCVVGLGGGSNMDLAKIVAGPGGRGGGGGAGL